MNGAWLFLFTIILDLVGATCIRDAVIDFKKERYFSFGVDVMIAVSACISMASVIFSVFVI